MSPADRRPFDLQQRLALFSVAVCRSLEKLMRNPVLRHAANQLIRSSTSPGANYAEARAAESRRDFVHKMQICLKELRETSVWLRFFDEFTGGRTEHAGLIQECNELTAIFVASIKTARRKPPDERSRDDPDALE